MIKHYGFVGCPTEPHHAEWWSRAGCNAGTAVVHPIWNRDPEGDLDHLAKIRDELANIAEVPDLSIVIDCRAEMLLEAGIKVNLERWENNLRWIAEQVKEMRLNVIGWEVWSEVDRDLSFSERISTVAGLMPVRIYEALTRSVKKATGGPVYNSGFGVWGHDSFGYALYDSAAWEMTDVLNIHPYDFPWPHTKAAERLREQLEELAKGGKPLATTEWGFPSHPQGHEVHFSSRSNVRVNAYNFEEHAAVLEQCLAVWQDYDVDFLAYHKLDDSTTLGDLTWQPHCGLLFNDPTAIAPQEPPSICTVPGMEGQPKPGVWDAFCRGVQRTDTVPATP